MKNYIATKNEYPKPLFIWGLTAGLFFYLFPVLFIPAGLPLVLLAYTIFAVLWVRRPVVVPLSAAPFGVAASLLVIATYAGLVTTLRGTNDLAFATQIAKVAILYLGSGFLIGVICVSFRVSNAFDVLIRAYVICCLIQAAFITVSIFSVQFRIIMDSLVLATGNTDYLISFRVRGFSASGGAAFGLNQAIGVLSALYLVVNSKNSNYFYVALAIWVPIFFVARTGFFVGAIFILLYFLSFERILIFLKTILLRPVGLAGTIFAAAAMTFVLPNLSEFFDAEAKERIESALRWGLEIFLNSQSGVAETETTNALLKMLVIPHEASFFLFGFGVFDNGAFGYERTDSGYLKTWYSSGIIGVLSLYFVIFYALLQTAWRYNSKNFKIYITLIVITMAVTEIKEPFLYQNYLGRYVFILIGAGAVINWYERRKRTT